MSKYFKLTMYVLIGMIAFTIGSKLRINYNTSIFRDYIIIPNTELQITSTSAEYYNFTDNFTIATADFADTADWAKISDYLKLSVYSKSNQVAIYGSDNLQSITASSPLVTCAANVPCFYETDVEYDYYQVQSTGKVDMQIVSGRIDPQD